MLHLDFDGGGFRLADSGADGFAIRESRARLVRHFFARRVKKALRCRRAKAVAKRRASRAARAADASGQPVVPTP